GGHVEGGQRLAVHRVRRGARDDLRTALVELQRDAAGDVLGDLVDERVVRFLQRREPLTEVDELRVARGDALLLVRRFAIERERLQSLQRRDQQRAARRLV